MQSLLEQVREWNAIKKTTRRDKRKEREREKEKERERVRGREKETESAKEQTMRENVNFIPMKLHVCCFVWFSVH